MIRLALAVVFAVQPVTPPPPLDLPALFPTAAPTGFAPLPDDPGRLGRLDTPAAAAVLDRSGAMSPQLLADAGFRHGHSKAWTNKDSQEVLLDVLLEFHSDGQGEDFTRRIVESRKDVTRFEVPGLPDAVGFERGPATPTYTTPGQREVVLRRGRVVAIVVVAGHVTFPAVELVAGVAQAQRAALEAVPLEATGTADDDRPVALLLAAQALFVLVSWRMATALQRTPLPFTPRPAPPTTPAVGPAIDAPPSEAPTATSPRRRRPSAP
ncbi:MAG TPA: hypothetical protein VM938_13865 [Acidimicrobiales bacterium]|nr:hypothetical protein [Acidimicrobiales bacterium]